MQDGQADQSSNMTNELEKHNNFASHRFKIVHSGMMTTYHFDQAVISSSFNLLTANIVGLYIEIFVLLH